MADFSIREMRDDDLPTLFEIQTDAGAQFMAAFTDISNDREAYLQKWRKLLADDGIVKRVVVVDDAVVGSVVSFGFEGETDVTYWIQREFWGRGIATSALSMLIQEVTVRPLFGRTAYDNVASMRVLERNGFVRVREEESFADARNADIAEVVFQLD